MNNYMKSSEMNRLYREINVKENDKAFHESRVKALDADIVYLNSLLDKVKAS